MARRRCAWGWIGCTGAATTMKTCDMEGPCPACASCAKQVQASHDRQEKARQGALGSQRAARKAEKVALLGIQREPGYLYFLRAGDVYRQPKGRPCAGESARCLRDAFVPVDGYLYFLDLQGDVARVVDPRTAKNAKKAPTVAQILDVALRAPTEHTAQQRQILDLIGADMARNHSDLEVSHA